MEEYYYKPDNRKQWQKNTLLACLVLILLFVTEAVMDLPRNTASLFKHLSGTNRKS